MTTLIITAGADGFRIALRSPDREDFDRCLEWLKMFVPPGCRKYEPARRWVVDRSSAAALQAWANYCQRTLGATIRWDEEDGGPDEWAPPRRPAPADPYAALHLLPSAPPELIKAAYRRLAQIHHPDAGGTHERMVEINRAFETLSGRLAA